MRMPSPVGCADRIAPSRGDEDELSLHHLVTLSPLCRREVACEAGVGPAAQPYLVPGCLSKEFQLPTAAADVHGRMAHEPEDFSEIDPGEAIDVERGDDDVGLLGFGRPLEGLGAIGRRPICPRRRRGSAGGAGLNKGWEAVVVAPPSPRGWGWAAAVAKDSFHGVLAEGVDAP